MHAPRSSRLLDGPWALVGVALLTAAAHATVLAGGFVWLDHAHLEDRLAIAPPGAWLSLFTQGFAGTGYYRPLMALSLSLDAALAGGPLWFHAVTLAWHAAAATMTVLAAQALGLSRRAALVAGLLFGLHPATSLVAGAIAFRSEAIMTTALMALIVFHRRERPIAAGLALLVGALTKETALVLGPALLLALQLDPATRQPLRRRRLWGAEATALVIALALRFTFAPAWRAAHLGLSTSEAIGTRLASLSKSAAALLVPYDRTICDAFVVRSALHPWALAGGAVLVGLGVLAWRRRGPAWLLPLALLPSLQLVPVMRWWSPHYLYLPLVFAAICLAPLIVSRRAFAAAGALLLVAYGALSLHSGLRFRSDEQLWTDEVVARPACREGHFFLGEARLARRDLDGAAEHYQQALAAWPGVIAFVDRQAALQNLGVARLQQGRFDEAATSFRAALEATGDASARRQLVHNLATATLAREDAAEAARLLEEEVARPDAHPQSMFIRARALQALGRTDEANALMQRLRDTRP